jgi:hypothetical protein
MISCRQKSQVDEKANPDSDCLKSLHELEKLCPQIEN